MPTFRFEGSDVVGSPREGQITASDANAAVAQLSRQGVRVSRIAIATQSAPAPAPATKPRLTAAPAVRPAAVQPTADRPQPTAVRTPKVSNRHLSFLFAQLASLWNAGVAPSLAVSRLADQERRPHLRGALTEIARETAEKGSLSSGMARYPDIFAPGTVGAIAAAEAGGYLPETCRELEERYRDASVVGLHSRLLRAEVLIAGLIGIPLAVTWTKASVVMTDEIVNGGADSADVRLDILFREAWRAFFGWPVWMMVGGFALYLLVRWAMKQRGQLSLRHRIGLALPVFGHFAKQQNLAAFNRHLERLSAAGLHPALAWRLAAGAVPNTAFRDRLLSGLQGAGEQTPYAQILQRARVLGAEESHVVANAEFTGTLPDAFRHLVRSAEEKQAVWAKARLVTFMTSAAVLTGLLVLVALTTFYGGYYQGVINAALKGTEGE
ncbi:MAG: type II secretion system F family protein [Fimbriimonadaceae bacterium]|nr:type II secretion system F family protein [Fimbriimonadaceae bacterium]QYK56274.1 MAG: type II secretion system F family protein [Fimbriimonadaceae bacterium]